MEIPAQDVDVTVHIPAQTVSVDLGYQVVTQTHTVSSGQGLDVTLTAPSGKKIVGFGYDGIIIENGSGFGIRISAPSTDGTSWRFKTGSTAEVTGGSLTTFLTCINA